MVDRKRYQKHRDMYRAGNVFELEPPSDDEPNGLLVWVKILSASEMDDCREDASIARKRMLLSMQQHESVEAQRFRSRFEATPIAQWVEEMVEYETRDAPTHARVSVQSDPDWADRLTVLENTDRAIAEISEDERTLLETAAHEVSQEILSRTAEAKAAVRDELTLLASSDRETLYRRSFDIFAEMTATIRGLQEYELTHMWLSLRVCSATLTKPAETDPDTNQVTTEAEYDHTGCENHRHLVYASKEELRDEHMALKAVYNVAVARAAVRRDDARKGVSSLSS